MTLAGLKPSHWMILLGLASFSALVFGYMVGFEAAKSQGIKNTEAALASVQTPVTATSPPTTTPPAPTTPVPTAPPTAPPTEPPPTEPPVTEPPPTTLPPQPALLLTVSGSADTSSEDFSVGRKWELGWTVSGGAGIIVEVLDSENGRVDSVNMDPGSSKSLMREACKDCHLKVSTFGASFTVTVTNLP